jgi:hypothetical protein
MVRIYGKAYGFVKIGRSGEKDDMELKGDGLKQLTAKYQVGRDWRYARQLPKPS